MNTLINGDARWSPHLGRIARELITTVAYLVGETEDPAQDAPQPEFSSHELEFIRHFRVLKPEDRLAIVTLTRSLTDIGVAPITFHEERAPYDVEGDTTGER